MRRWWPIARCNHVLKSRLSTSSQYLHLGRRQRPISKPTSKPISKLKNESLKAVAKPWENPSQSIQPKQKHPSFWQDVYAVAAMRWNGTKLPVKMAFIAVVMYFSGLEIIYQFYLDRVPITGRKQLSWTSESVLQELDDQDRQWVEEIRENRERSPVKVAGPVLEMIYSIADRLIEASGLESLSKSLLKKLEERFGRSVKKLGIEKEEDLVEERRIDKENGSMEVDGPALKMITSVLNRLVKASGLHEMAWEVRVTNEPNVANAWISKSGLVTISSGYIGDIIENDDELAAALGHEVAHIIAGHELESHCLRKVDRNFNQTLLVPALAWFLYRPALVFALPALLSSLVTLALSKIWEREADYISLLLMEEAGFNLTGAVSLWTKYNRWEDEQRRQSKSKRKWYQPRKVLFNSEHPHSAVRIKDIEKLIPDVKSILDGGTPTTDQPVAKPKLLAARHARWQDFADKRDELRRQA